MELGEGLSKIKFSLVVSESQRRESSDKAERFGAEFASFLRENPTQILHPINPSREQTTLINFWLDSIKNKSLLLKKTDNEISPVTEEPMIHKFYSCEEDSRTSDVLASLSNMFTDRSINYHIGWQVRKDFPSHSSIYGFLGLKDPGTIEFKFYPEKPVTKEIIDKYEGPTPKYMISRKLDIYRDGQRIDFDNVQKYKGKEYSRTTSFYFLGSFEGEETHKTYFVYGSNRNKKNRVSVNENVSVRETSKSTSAG